MIISIYKATFRGKNVINQVLDKSLLHFDLKKSESFERRIAGKNIQARVTCGASSSLSQSCQLLSGNTPGYYGALPTILG